MRRGAPQYAVDIGGGEPHELDQIGAVGHKPATGGEEARRVDRGQAMTDGRCHNPIAVHGVERVRQDQQPARWRACQCVDRDVDLGRAAHAGRDRLNAE